MAILFLVKWNLRYNNSKMKMKIIRIVVTFFALVFGISLLQCQDKETLCAGLSTDSSLYEDVLTGEYFCFNNIQKGPKYLNLDWYMGDVLLENNKVVSNQYFNFHLPSRQIIWFRGSDSNLVVLDRSKIKQLTLHPGSNKANQVFRKLSFRPYFLIDTNTCYLQILAEGKITLFANRKITVLSSTNEAVRNDEYYIQIGQNSIKSFFLNKWKLYAIIKEDKVAMRKIIRSNHLRVKHEEDMIKALTIFNQQSTETSK
jgi:hypothetical protein